MKWCMLILAIVSGTSLIIWSVSMYQETSKWNAAAATSAQESRAIWKSIQDGQAADFNAAVKRIESSGSVKKK